MPDTKRSRRPTRKAKTLTDLVALANGNEEFAAMFAQDFARVRDQLAQFSDVLVDLSPEQCEELAVVVVRLSSRYGSWQRFPRLQKWFRVEATLGRGQRRKFKAKVMRALGAVDDALKYASTINADSNKFLAGALRDLATPHLLGAQTALHAIRLNDDRLTTPSSERFTDFGRSSGLNPQADATAALISFFDGCGLGQYETDRRTGLVGNHLSWWKVAIDDEYVDGDPGARGCSAIRKRRTRRLRSRDTARRSRR
jgi:hypothetical protein